MYYLIIALLVIICVFLVLVVLVQNPKGGGMGAGFGGAASSASGGGVQRTTDFLEKATWGLAIAFFALSLVSNLFTPTNSVATDSSDQIENVLDDN